MLITFFRPEGGQGATSNLTALQVVRTSFLGPRPCLSPPVVRQILSPNLVSAAVGFLVFSFFPRLSRSHDLDFRSSCFMLEFLAFTRSNDQYISLNWTTALLARPYSWNSVHNSWCVLDCRITSSNRVSQEQWFHWACYFRNVNRFNSCLSFLQFLHGVYGQVSPSNHLTWIKKPRILWINCSIIFYLLQATTWRRSDHYIWNS